MAGERSFLTVPYDTDLNDDDQNIDALIRGRIWDTTTNKNITFSFTDQASDYSYTFESGRAFSGALNSQQQDAARMSLNHIAELIDVTFTELAFGSADGTLRYGEFTGIGTASAYFPSGNEPGGDLNFHHMDYDAPVVGNYQYSTFIHELGHAMGLKHGHETGTRRPLERGSGQHRIYDDDL